LMRLWSGEGQIAFLLTDRRKSSCQVVSQFLAASWTYQHMARRFGLAGKYRCRTASTFATFSLVYGERCALLG
jgi:hypothetical protein